MRKHPHTLLALALVVGLPVSCTLITEVDRGEIPDDTGGGGAGGTVATGGSTNLGGNGGDPIATGGSTNLGGGGAGGAN